MRPEYEGVKYYSAEDWSLGHSFEKAKEILDSFVEKTDYCDINEVIELYNIYQIILSPGIKPEDSAPYLNKAKNVMKKVGCFFNGISDSNLLDNYKKVCIDYLDDFWTLFEKLKIYNIISDSVFKNLLHEPETTLFKILEHKEIVKKYDSTLADFMKRSDQTARIIISKYLERKSNGRGDNCYIPNSFKPGEFELILDEYIDSEYANVGLLQLIASSQSSAECPISDRLRLKARKKAKDFWETHINEGIGFSYGIGVCFKENADIISYEEIKPLEYQFVYDVNWIKRNLDYPTLLNNFIYLFEYVDFCCRCTFVSAKSKMSVLERHLGVKGIKEYETGVAFNIANIKSSAEMQGYKAVLLEEGICIENIIKWFFEEYLKEEFQADGFRIQIASKFGSILEKCKTIATEMDSIFKQYKLYVENRTIDRELLEISSSHIRFNELPSMINNKYAYAKSEEILKEQFFLFSDQSMLNYIPKYKETKSFYDLLKQREVKLTDYPEWEKPNLKWLESRGAIIIDNQEVIAMNIPKVTILRDLYYHDVVCGSYYKNQDIIKELVDSGDLQYSSSLFSEPEQSYLNYMLNKSEFSNGLDLRNKYVHGTYSLDEKQQEQDYLRLLKIMIVVIIKINEEFCLHNPK